MDLGAYSPEATAEYILHKNGGNPFGGCRHFCFDKNMEIAFYLHIFLQGYCLFAHGFFY